MGLFYRRAGAYARACIKSIRMCVCAKYKRVTHNARCRRRRDFAQSFGCVVCVCVYVSSSLSLSAYGQKYIEECARVCGCVYMHGMSLICLAELFNSHQQTLAHSLYLTLSLSLHHSLSFRCVYVFISCVMLLLCCKRRILFQCIPSI